MDKNKYLRANQTISYRVFYVPRKTATLEGGMVDLKQSETQQPHIQDTEIQP